MPQSKSIALEALQEELRELRHQLYEANETIEAIRLGQIDALVVEGSNGSELYTLKTADQAYRFFIENMAEGAVTLNKEGIILYCNSQFAAMVAAPISNVIGSFFKTFIAAESGGAYHEIFQQCWTQDCKNEALLTSVGRHIPVQLSLTSLVVEEKPVVNIIVTDLSAQKKTQQQLEEANQRLALSNQALEASNHDLQQFASVASHDLQEPLRKIQIFSSLLIQKPDGALPPESKKYISKIIDSARRMKTLIVDVLNYSRLSAHHAGFSLVDLTEVLQEVLEDFELIIQEKKAVVRTTPLPSIEANRGQMRQVFQNVISNALKFAQKDKAPEIGIAAKLWFEKSFDSHAQPDGAYCLISVKDNGIGFSEAYLENIFALFERLHTKDSYEGTGIGLAITKKIMEKHNGMVSAKSSPGAGAEFLLLLPVKQEK